MGIVNRTANRSKMDLIMCTACGRYYKMKKGEVKEQLEHI
jgi:hypothetical protein